jgi:hypothetical protein
VRQDWRPFQLSSKRCFDRGALSLLRLDFAVHECGVSVPVVGAHGNQLKESIMHRPAVLSLVLAACLASTVAFAARDRATANFEASASSPGITGAADLSATPQGETIVHGQLRGLEAGAQYASFVYQGNATCASGTPMAVAQFQANPTGVATFNAKVKVDLTQIGSISIQRVSDNSLVACGAVQ